MVRLLSRVEQAYLNGTRDFTKAQQRYIRYRLKKKLRLIDESRDAAAAQLQRLVAQPAERKVINETASPSRDLNPGPKVYETFALPAELLGQNKGTSAARYLMLRAKINTTEISFLV